tara:strand:+ start:437 stop:904 length:468 start_codon:yes stop_codon:yes gene_type:complete
MSNRRFPNEDDISVDYIALHEETQTKIKETKKITKFIIGISLLVLGLTSFCGYVLTNLLWESNIILKDADALMKTYQQLTPTVSDTLEFARESSEKVNQIHYFLCVDGTTCDVCSEVTCPENSKCSPENYNSSFKYCRCNQGFSRTPNSQQCTTT